MQGVPELTTHDPAAPNGPAPASSVPVRLPSPIPLPVRRLDPGLPLPAYARPGDAGLDLSAAHDVTLAPGQRCLVPTGIAVAIPAGHVGFVNPRSGLAARHGLGIVNAPGTVDSGYRGEILVNLVNHDPAATIQLRRGDRIAQLVVVPFSSVTPMEVEALDETERGTTGHGASGGFAGDDHDHHRGGPH